MGTRRTGAGVERVYAAAQAWVDAALRDDSSLFTPGEAIWTKRRLEELRRRFLDRPDESKMKFLEKLRGQLDGSPPEVHQLMAEALYLHLLIVSTRNGNNKRRTVDTVLGWSSSPATIQEELVAALAPGIATPGQYFHVKRPNQVGFLIELVEQWKELGADERTRLLANPWEFKDFATGLEPRSALLKDEPNSYRTQREALLHLVFPDTFEAIVSSAHKQWIAGAFAKSLQEPAEDVDRRLAQIRPEVEARFGAVDSVYYQPEIRALWDAKYAPDLWGEFVRRAREYHDTGKLEADEIGYKRDIGGRLAAARQAVTQGGDDWIDLVKRGIGGNLVHRIEQAKFRDWMDEAPDDARFALQMLWEGDEDEPGERIASFCELLPDQASSGPGTRTTLASVLLMGLDVELYPPFRTTPFDRAYQQIAYGEPEQGASEADIYGHALEFLDRFIEEASERDLAIGNRLEAQSLVWAIQDEERPPPPPPEENLEELAAEMMWEPERLRMVIHGLEDKGQVIFYGPPGTGKTFMARRIAQWYRQRGGDYRIIQFHPSYTYEDFVEGFRPTLTETGQAGFELAPGPLRRIAEQAEANPEGKFILVIDEINRGNLAKILGELYFLLEYRGEEMLLQYSHQPFRLPQNLWFIGTMNTTDRSIALVDAALRRRFYFFGFYPDESPIRGLLRRWLSRNEPEAMWVADLVDAANRKLDDRHLGIGPSHFMKQDPPLDEPRVRFIWEQAVLPYIEEQFFGDEARLKEFDYGRLLSEINSSAMSIDAGDDPPQSTSASGDGQANDDGHDAAP